MARKKIVTGRSARHKFGTRLRRYREGEGLSLEALGKEVRMSRSQLARVELGEAMPPPELPEVLDRLFQVDDYFLDLYELCALEIHPDRFRRLMEFEARATVIRGYTGPLVPGLLQTEAYTRAHIAECDPNVTPEAVGELVAARMARQARLRAKDAPEYAFILDEAALKYRFGTPAQWREQLARLADAADNPRGIVQILPSESGGHALLGGSLMLLTMECGTEVAYEESITTGTLIEESRLVLHRARAYHRLTARAWSPTKTAAHIRSLMEELPT
ncbi:Scr1 family TA system antitoxin-like transcriptional regulator [Streptomyces sp. NPDC000594]|uniref:Scr1 family TA system antitoxin-like transcriptional regulator n=1 Tax=Streptomyces sp. NPDC000594 TaxID=3154261 RepID=UPI00332EE8D0